LSYVGHLRLPGLPQLSYLWQGFLQLPLVACLQASVYAVVAKSLDEIPVAREYLDMFPDDLLKIPPDRTIEFKIELQPGTAPVYKQLYPMA
jgi:hypothetical protein